MFSQDTRERNKFTRCQEQYPFVFTMQTRWVTFLCMFVLGTIENLGGKKGILECEGRGIQGGQIGREVCIWEVERWHYMFYKKEKKEKEIRKIKRCVYLYTSTAWNSVNTATSFCSSFPPPLLIIYWCKQLAHAKQILCTKSQLSEGGSSIWQSAFR